MTATIAKAVNGRKFIFRWNLKKMFADKMYVDEPTRRSTGRWLTQVFFKKSVLDMCMFHVSQWSLSIVTIAFVLLSSFQTIWKCQVRLAAQEAEGGGREGEGEGEGDRGGCRVLPFRWSSNLGNDDIISVFVNRYMLRFVTSQKSEITFLAHG